MSAHLWTGIRMCDAAWAILRKTRTFPTAGYGEDADANNYDHIGVEPMLLALSMEPALKAWIVLGSKDTTALRMHNLPKLFERAKRDSLGRVDTVPETFSLLASDTPFSDSSTLSS